MGVSCGLPCILHHSYAIITFHIQASNDNEDEEIQLDNKGQQSMSTLAITNEVMSDKDQVDTQIVDPVAE